MMRILLTNDDGIEAPGMAVLAHIAAQLSDDVWTVAPAEEQSGTGHSLTLTAPIRLKQVGNKRFAVRGTPTDSVMMALGHVMKDHRPDLILSGVNRGPNMAEDVTYSGTVSAAMEGCLAGVRSIALSQALADYTVGSEDFGPARTHGPDIVRRLAALGTAAGEWPSGVLMNVNFPPTVTAAPPVVVARQGFRDYGNIRIDARTDPRGFPYFWFGYGREMTNPAGETDLHAIRNGAIAVTPLHLDLTHDATLAAVAKALL